MMNHLIHKQSVELEVSSVPRAMEVQDRFRQAYYERLLPRMEDVFTEFSHKGLTYRIEKLELDLGSIPEEAFEEKIVERFLKVLRESLKHQLADEELFSLGNNGQVIPVSQEARRMNLVLYFIEHGMLPWWASRESMAKLEETAKEILFTHNERKLFIQKLILLPAGKVAKRISQQFTDGFLQFLTQSLLEEETDEVKSWIELVEEIISISKETSVAGKIWYRTLLSWVLQVHQKSLSAKVAAELMVGLLKKERAYAPLLKKLTTTALPNEKLVKTETYSAHQLGFLKYLSKELFPEQAIQPGNSPIFPLKTGQEIVPTEKEQVRLEVIETHGPEEGIRLVEESEVSFLSEEGVFIQNAGLVLIAPFLSSFFAKLGLIEKREFKDETSQERALLLSQFLLTGKNEFPEPDLLLNKVLCGWPIQKPVPKGFQPTDHEIKEAEDLLSSVITHWEVIKNTSVENFQQFFLQREGKLSIHPDQYFLKVQREGADILLEKLPWNISFQRFAWMDRPLIVEW